MEELIKEIHELRILLLCLWLSLEVVIITVGLMIRRAVLHDYRDDEYRDE